MAVKLVQNFFEALDQQTVVSLAENWVYEMVSSRAVVTECKLAAKKVGQMGVLLTDLKVDLMVGWWGNMTVCKLVGLKDKAKASVRVCEMVPD